MKRGRLGLGMLFAAVYLAGWCSMAVAVVTSSGDIDPVDPTTWTSSTDVYVGKTDEGSVTVDSGDVIDSNASYLGYEDTATGQMTVSGSGSEWRGSGSLYVGYNGSGSLAINDGGLVNNNHGFIGYGSDSVGTVSVRGTNSRWYNRAHVHVGYSGRGTLSITDGAAVYMSAFSGFIGDHTGSTGEVTVSGSGSKWSGNGYLYVGDYGKATLVIADGGLTGSSRVAYVGHYSGSEGDVLVTGSGSAFNNSVLYIGYAGSGTLTIADGGSVTASSMTGVAADAGSSGVIHFGTGGGTLTTKTLRASPTQITGSGTIYAQGLVSDVDLTFDSTESLVQTVKFDSEPDQDISVNLDMSDTYAPGVLGAGYRGSGSLTIRNGVTIVSSSACLGSGSGSSGYATVTGAGSTWSNKTTFQIGLYGNGHLTISDGGVVAMPYSNYEAYLGYYAGSTGEVMVSGSGSAWTFKSSDVFVGNAGNGTLTITDGGTVSNGTKSDYCYVGYESGSTGTVIVDGDGSTFTFYGGLWFGYSGNGTLTITNGGTVSGGSVGYASGSRGVATISGAGSTWNGGRTIGCYGHGTMNIVKGGTVIADSSGRIAYASGSVGKVTVNGAGSTWTINTDLCVGYSGEGTLCLTDGGVVSAANVSVNSQSLVSMTLGDESQLVVGDGSGTVTNDGVVRLIVGAGPLPGQTYETPVLAGTWAGSGTYQAMGGTWAGPGHVFTASEVVEEDNDTWLTTDLAEAQRILIHDEVTGWSLRGSLLATDKSTEIMMIARAATGTVLESLEDAIAPGQTVLSGWQIATSTNYAGKPAYLTLDIDGLVDGEGLTVWRYSGSTWSPYEAADLVRNGTCASFLASSLNDGYAITGVAVPEPGGIVLLLGLGGLLLGCRRRYRGRPQS